MFFIDVFIDAFGNPIEFKSFVDINEVFNK